MSDWRRKYVLMAENDIQYPVYNPEKHKTLIKGAIDYELNGDKVITYLPFQEEPEYMVQFPAVDKSELERWLNIDIETQEDLDNAEMSDIRAFYVNKINRQTTSETDLMREVMDEPEIDYEKLYGALSMVKAVVQKYARDMDDSTAYEFRKQLGDYYFIK